MSFNNIKRLLQMQLGEGAEVWISRAVDGTGRGTQALFPHAICRWCRGPNARDKPVEKNGSTRLPSADHLWFTGDRQVITTMFDTWEMIQAPQHLPSIARLSVFLYTPCYTWWHAIFLLSQQSLKIRSRPRFVVWRGEKSILWGGTVFSPQK